MSLQLNESIDNIKPFPQGKNVRAKITGLTLCRFTNVLSTFRFLRHVPNHELLMRITQMGIDMSNKKTIVIKLDDDQTVEIAGASPTGLADHIYPTNDPNESFHHIVKMKTGLHGGNDLEDKPQMPPKRPTWLRINHCAFYTYARTQDEFFFEDEAGATLPENRYCQVLGGYMSYTENLRISIESNGIPFILPSAGFLYEIEFSNTCDSTPRCEDREDFEFMYDIVQQRGNPRKKYKLKKKRTKAASTGTGACLPGCEDC